MFVGTVESAEQHLIEMPSFPPPAAAEETTRLEILAALELPQAELEIMCANLRWGAHDHGRVFVRRSRGLTTICVDRVAVIEDGEVTSSYRREAYARQAEAERLTRRAQHEAYLVRREQVMDAILQKQPVAFFDGCEGGVFTLDDSTDGYRHACVSVRGTCRALGLSMETMPMGSLACALYVVWSGQRWRLADDEGMDFDPPREFTSGRVDRRPEW